MLRQVEHKPETAMTLQDTSINYTRIRTRFARSLKTGLLPKALMSMMTFFFLSGRHMAKITGLWGLRRNRKISRQSGGSGAPGQDMWAAKERAELE